MISANWLRIWRPYSVPVLSCARLACVTKRKCWAASAAAAGLCAALPSSAILEPVSIRMAKDQNLSLNPAKISGVCGRLMCCLKYENDVYCSGCCGKRSVPERVEAPKVGVMVVTPLGEGRVMGVNRAMRTASVQLTPDNTIQVEWDEIVDASKADKI